MTSFLRLMNFYLQRASCIPFSRDALWGPGNKACSVCMKTSWIYCPQLTILWLQSQKDNAVTLARFWDEVRVYLYCCTLFQPRGQHPVPQLSRVQGFVEPSDCRASFLNLNRNCLTGLHSESGFLLSPSLPPFLSDWRYYEPRKQSVEN